MQYIPTYKFQRYIYRPTVRASIKLYKEMVTQVNNTYDLYIYLDQVIRENWNKQHFEDFRYNDLSQFNRE